MNGDGWKCDECGVQVVKPDDRYMNRQPGYSDPPVGWFVVLAPTSESAPEANRKDLCSADCLQRYTMRFETGVFWPESTTALAWRQRAEKAEAELSAQRVHAAVQKIHDDLNAEGYSVHDPDGRAILAHARETNSPIAEAIIWFKQGRR